mmetsp:Transcript_96895/g.172474  ORF Transcript_96895/g.172474 Transcript_96895/m.172474 type:complete len:378 (+) Transcript_96895:77-1210(+)
MGLNSSCCSKDDSLEADALQRISNEASDPKAETDEKLPGEPLVFSAIASSEDGNATADSKNGEEGKKKVQDTPGLSDKLATLRQMLRVGQFLEVEKQIEEESTDRDEDTYARSFLKSVMPQMRGIAPRARLPSEKDGWAILDLADIGMHIYLKRSETIDVCFSVDLPDVTWEQMLAMNWEADLSSQWLPFNPEVATTHGTNSSSMMMHVSAKIPVLPGHREVIICRHVVDCFSPDSVIDGRRGLLIVEKSPDNWNTGGKFMEFDVAPPSSSRWVTRDEQLESFTFYEYVNPTTIRCMITYKLIFQVPSWLFPDSALHWLAKLTGRQWYAGLLGALKKYTEYGYKARAEAREHPIYDAVVARARAAAAGSSSASAGGS